VLARFDAKTIAGARPALAAGIVGLAIDGAYLGIIRSQGDGFDSRVVLIALYIAATSGFAFAGALANATPFTRLVVLGTAAGGLLALGLLAIFSIGLLLLVAGSLSAAAWVRFAASLRPVPNGAPLASAAAAIAAGALLIAGVALT
jgi:hypothetical protein